MKKILLSLFVIIAMTSLQANAFDFMSILKFWDSAVEAQAAMPQTTKTLDDIKNQMSVIDNSVETAFLNIVKELSTRKETKDIKNQLKSNSDNLAQVISNYTNTLVSNKDNFVKTINNLSSKEKTNLINNLAVLSEDAQQYLLLATDGVKTATNAVKTTQKLSEFATTVSNINSIASQLKNRAATVISFANQAKTIMQAAGLTVQ